jgi:hypothetical protein
MTDKPKSPHLVLLVSLIPGAGHVMLGQSQRGLTFIFFMVILGWVSYRMMPETASFFSRHVGGIFIYGLSILEAYRIAKLRALTHAKPSQSNHDQNR